MKKIEVIHGILVNDKNKALIFGQDKNGKRRVFSIELNQLKLSNLQKRKINIDIDAY